MDWTKLSAVLGAFADPETHQLAPLAITMGRSAFERLFPSDPSHDVFGETVDTIELRVNTDYGWVTFYVDDRTTDVIDFQFGAPTP